MIRDDIERILAIIIIILVVALIGIGIAKLEDINDKETYNNGICSVCNQTADYKLVNVEKRRYDLYYYQCSHCGHAIQLHKQIY